MLNIAKTKEAAVALAKSESPLMAAAYAVERTIRQLGAADVTAALPFLEDLDCCIEVLPTGSRFVCDPPVTDTDVDYVVLVGAITEALGDLQWNDWNTNEPDDSYEHQGNREVPFATARKGNINLIIYEDVKGYEAFTHATAICALLNLTDKWERKMLFRAICGNRD
jgi:hypothetical protein